jgi:hypothetical protein
MKLVAINGFFNEIVKAGGDATRPVLLTNAPASIGLLGGTYALTKLTTPAH